MSRIATIACLASLALVASFLASIALGVEDSSPKIQPQTAPRPVKITISKETTYLTGPIRSDGWLDYATAINQRHQSGVTPENNAAIPFWRAVGPKAIPKNKRDPFFKILGIQPLPEEGHYLIQLYEYSQHAKESPALGTPESNKWLDDIDNQARIAQSRPWSRKEFPILAGWLDANAMPLEIICAGVGRSRFFEPLITKPNGSLLDALDITGFTCFRQAVELLRLRAMLHVAEGGIDDAWHDLLVCHRLARLEGQKAFLIDTIVARALERSACDGDVALVHYAHAASEKLEQFHRELMDLPAMLPLEAGSLAERLFSLDTLRQVALGIRWL